MAYIFDPLRNTFIDDEDTSLGNKLAFLDEDLEKAIREIGEKYGPDTIKTLNQLPENKPTEVEDTERFNRFNKLYQDGGRVNLAAAIPLAPMAIAPLAKAFGISTAGLGVMEASNKIANYLKENPSVMNTPEFRAIALTFGLKIPGVIAPDAGEMEKQKQEIEKLEKERLKGTPPPKIETKEEFPADDKPLPVIEGFPADDKPLPVIEGFPGETQQLPIIFESKKFENKKDEKTFNEIKGTFDKAMDLYEGGMRFGGKEIGKELYTKQFANKVKKFIDNKYGGNTQALANQLDIERVRINTLFRKYGIKTDRAGNKTLQNIFLEQDEDKLSVVDLTNNIKGNETYLIDRAKNRFVNYERNKNKLLNYKDIAEILGVDITDKYKQDFFQTKLRNAKKKIGIKTEQGSGKEILYNLGDTITALTKLNLGKPIAGTGDIYSKGRINFEKKIDNAGFGARTYILEQIRDASKEVLGEETILRAGEQYGHAEALANIQKYSKLFKNSNATDITTLVFQDPVLNVDVLQAYGSSKTGIEQKRQPFLNTLEKLIGKKATAENIQIANEALNGLNELNNEARIQIKRFQKTNRFVRDQENRIPDYELTLPKEGETFKSGFLNIDMSSIDPSVSVGRILEINPDAKTFSDLSKEEQNLYRENLRNQITDFLKYFYQESGVNREDILSLEEEILEKNLKSKVAAAKGGPIELSPMPRVNFNSGGAAGADDDFAAQLEYFFLNPEAELPAAQTFRETMNPISIINDMIDPRNIPYYADRLVKSGIRIGEFGARVLPAVGKLAADLIQKPAFKIKSASGQGYVQDYTDIPPSNITGTGIFSEFLNNLIGDEGTKAITEKTGLAKLIRDEEQKMKDERKTAGAKILADQFTLGMELTAPIFPGLKLLKAYAKSRNLPVDKTTREIMDKEIDEVLTKQGINRRDFMKVAGAGATVAIAKLLGFGDDMIKASKVTRAAPIMDNTVEGMPAWFKDAVFAIERKGLLKSRGDIKGIEPDFFEITLDTKLGKKTVLMSKNDTTGEITLDWTTNYYDMDVPVTIMYRPGNKGKQNFLSDPEFPQSVEKYDVEVDAPEFEYKSADVQSIGPDDVNFDSSVNLDIKEEADAVVEALEELGLGLTKKQKKDAADNFRYYNDVQLDETSTGPDTANPIDESDAYTFLDMIKRNTDK